VRELQILLTLSRAPLLAFTLIVLGGGLLFHRYYTFPGTNDHPTLSLALFASFALIFFETVLPYPDQWFFQVLYFLIPILGLIALADGLLQFGSTLLSRQARGQKWQVAMAATYKDHIVICGAGKVGYRVLLELLKFDREVVLIERNPEGRFVQYVQDLSVPLVIEDATRRESLLKAGVERASSIVPCTDDELRNLDIALEAREIQPGIKVVMRMFDADLARRVEKGFGIHTAFSTSALSAPIFASAAMRMDVKHSFYVEDTLLMISELIVAERSSLAGMRVGELEENHDLSVICSVVDDCADLHPEGRRVIAAGEKLLILSSRKNFAEVQHLNKPS
jgi:Trk K+ transport system NAD-binding subunit